MIPVYVSNGAFITRNNGRDYRLIGKYPALLDADGVEFLMYFVWQDAVEELRRFLKSTQFYFPVTHMDKQIGETLSERGLEGKADALKLFERDLVTACEIGSQKLVLHLWNGPCSDSRFDETLGVCEDMLNMAQKRGTELTVENVTCKQNLSLDHLAKLKALFPAMRFTYDTKMAHLHGENALLGSEKYVSLLKDKAISHLHVNDTLVDCSQPRLPIMHIGDGQVDFGAFFSLIRACGYSGSATVESTSVNSDGSVNVEKLNRSLARVRRELNASEA